MPGFLEDYQPVEDRLREFWNDHPNGRIATQMEMAPEGEYIFAAAVFRDGEDAPAATGFAHETVATLPQNMKASALETCETSAIGRALANLGYAPKGKRPSREEMEASGAGPLHGGGSAPDPSPPADESQGQEGPAGGNVGSGRGGTLGKVSSSPADDVTALWSELLALTHDDWAKARRSIRDSNEEWSDGFRAADDEKATPANLTNAIDYLKAP